MPASYVIDPGLRLVVTTYDGHVTDSDMIEHARRLAADPAFSADYDQLVDTLAVETISVTARGIRELASLNPFGEGSRRAVVADRDVVYGLSRLFEMSIGDSADELTVCRTMEEACSWLHLSRAETTSRD